MHNRVHVKAMAVAAVALMVSAALMLKSCEMTSNQYSTYNEAKAKGAIGAWLPSSIPQSARDIREAHHTDTNELWFEFQFDNWMPEASGQCYQKVRPGLLTPSERLPDFAREWPSVFASDKQIVFFSCASSTSNYDLAISGNSRLVRGWSLGDSATLGVKP